MDIERVKEFLVIAEEKSFKKAANRLQIAPNVLNTRYHNFEKSLGTTLLTANAHQLELTDNGRLFLESARELTSSYEKMLEDLDIAGNTSKQKLTLEICGNGIDAPGLGPYLDLYGRNYPHTELNLLSDNTYRISDDFASGNVDIFIAYGDENEFNDIAGRICLSHAAYLCAYIANDHPLATRSYISFQDLKNEQFLLYPEATEPCIRRHQLRCLDKSGIPYSIYSGTVDSVFYNLMVPIGKGVLLRSNPYPVPPNSTILHITDKGYDTYTYLLYDIHTDNAAVHEFITGLLNYLEETI